MDKVDCIVVGAGPAGSACALSLARKGIETVLVERGRYAGEKNLASFVLFTQILEQLVPEFREEAPLERAVTDNSYLAIGKEDYLQFQTRFYRHAREGFAYTAFRRQFDQWLAGRAEKAGAKLVTGILATDLLMDKGRVVGIKAGDDELLADVVVGADGVHSMVARKSGLVTDDPSRYQLGIKEVLDLPPEVIEERFQLGPGEGAIKECFGYPVDDVGGVYSLYTNKDSISIAIFAPIEILKEKKVRLSDRLEMAKDHPYISSLIEGAGTRQYLSHVLPDGGWIKPENLYADGVVLCGEAGGFNTYSWVGVPPGMLSGMMAAKAIAIAKQKDDYGAKNLGRYIDFLNETVLPEEMAKSKKTSDYLIKSGRKNIGKYRGAAMEVIEGVLKSELDFLDDEPYPAGKIIYEKIAVDFTPFYLRWLARPLMYLVSLFSRKKKFRRKPNE
jgi:electron transfer flavoprotein-quinone oxidoreductase